MPEELAAAALATRGRPFLDGALWGYTPSFLTDGDTFVDFGDEHEGRRGRALTAAATVALSAAAGLGWARRWSSPRGEPARGGAAETPHRRARVGASGARVEDSVEDSVAEDSGVVAGKKKRGARGRSEAAAEARASLPRRTAFRRRKKRRLRARVKTKTNARTTTNLA